MPLATINPPYFVFPWVNVQDNWLHIAPPLSAASGHPKASGWMTTDNFIRYMKHFVNYTKPSPAKPRLLLLENHNSNISLEVIDCSEVNHITLLSFPPHCSHVLKLRQSIRNIHLPNGHGDYEPYNSVNCANYVFVEMTLQQ